MCEDRGIQNHNEVRKFLCFQKAEAEDLRQHPDALKDHCIVKLQTREQSERVTKPNQSRQRLTQALLL